MQTNFKMKSYLVVLLAAFLMLSCGEKQSGIVYVQNMRLYSEFDLALELDATLQDFSKKRTQELDSLNMALENMTAELENMVEIPMETYQNYNDLRNALMFREKNYEEELIAKSQEYDEQIWERLNGYVQTFAEANDYEMILGASENGNLMYAKDTLDITDELIEYCNNQYNGVK